MSLYQESTKTKPILFFETFINNQMIKKFEEMFYNYPYNPSQKAYKDQGYIKYAKDIYTKGFYEDGSIANEMDVPILEYFKDHFEKLLKSQLFISKTLLVERSNEIEYLNIRNDIFIEKQLRKIHTLRKDVEAISVHKVLVDDTLKELEKIAREIGDIKENSKDTNLARISKNPFFENKSSTRKRNLVQIYDLSIELGIIDEDLVFEDNFLNVFMSSSPEKIGDNIIFKANNQISTFFLNSISPFFNNLTHSQITKSKSFYNKNGKLLNQRDLDTAKNRYAKKMLTQKFEQISSAINRIID